MEFENQITLHEKTISSDGMFEIPDMTYAIPPAEVQLFQDLGEEGKGYAMVAKRYPEIHKQVLEWHTELRKKFEVFAQIQQKDKLSDFYRPKEQSSFRFNFRSTLANALEGANIFIYPYFKPKHLKHFWWAGDYVDDITLHWPESQEKTPPNTWKKVQTALQNFSQNIWSILS